jgi:uncharacterized coiled-coil DUF342 family protein
MFTLESFEQSVTPRKRRNIRHEDEVTSTPRSNPEFTNPADNNWRVTTKEVRQLIDGLKEIIAHQISVTESTRTKLQEVIEDKQTLKSQNKELHEEARALRTQIEGLETTLPTKSCGLCL